MAEESLLSALYEVHPVATFVADDDGRLLLANRSAMALLGPGERIQVDPPRRGGDLLHCSHVHDHPDGCGRGEHCKTCVVRGTLNRAFECGGPSSGAGEVDLIREGAVRIQPVQVVAIPLAQDGLRIALLTVQTLERARPGLEA